MKRIITFTIAAAAASLIGSIFFSAAQATDGPLGITRPVVLPEFDTAKPACSKPTGLERKLVFAQDNDRQFMQGVRNGLAAAAKDRSLDFEVFIARNDPWRMVEQVNTAHQTNVGGLVASPVDPASLAPYLQKIIWSGGYVGTIVPPPATSLLNAPQYLTGKVLGDAAARYILNELRGKAKVVLLTHDKLQFLAPRFTALRDALAQIPGVEIVADISPVTVDKEGGAEMMKTILLANSDIDVVLGADTVVLGALKALRDAGKARANQYLGGIDGELEALEEIKTGGPYKSSVSLASSVFGYAMGQHAGDWLEGKSIPKAMDILPKLLSKQNLASYEADLSDPAAVFADLKRRTGYLKMYGNICFDTRDQYINFAWTSERK